MKSYIIGEYTYTYQKKTWMLYDENDQPVAVDGNCKEAMIYAAIQEQRPRIYEAAIVASQRHPKRDGFVWRAAQLLVNRHVYEPREENQIREVARVRSETFSYARPFDKDAGYDRDGLYSIQHEGFLTCNCTSYHADYGPRTKQGHKLCKHILAVMLARATDTPFERFPKIETELDNLSLDELNTALFG